MALVVPFRALRYDRNKITDMSRVVSPPYDVINRKQQQAFYDADPHNIIRVELNQSTENDTLEENCYSRAGRHFRLWQREGVLRRDSRPAFYINETTYTDADGRTRVRKGILTLLRIEDFSSGTVLPHEKTFTSHREDRFKLTQATGANISPIFALYPDDENWVQALLEKARNPHPLTDFVDPAGLPQKLYAVEDPGAIAEVQKLMTDKAIFIADGHHRYETALSYRDHMHARHPGAGAAASFNYVMVYLCSMRDPGLTVFPCHRLLPHFAGFSTQDFLALAKPYFDHVEIPINGNPEEARTKMVQTLSGAGQRRPSFGLASTESDAFCVLSLKEGIRRNGPMHTSDPRLRDLDVVVLTDIVLEHILGLDNSARDHVHAIKYLSDTKEVVDKVLSARAQLVFLLNPTRVEQVKAVAEAGLIMPRKSTYFYPKVLTGLTINLLNPAEEVSGRLEGHP